MLHARQDRLLLSGARRWSAVAGLAVDQLVAWGVLYYAYAIVSAPIARGLGTSSLVVAAAFSACLLVAGAAGRRLGPVLDARGTRDALRAGALLGPLAIAALAIADGPVSLVAACVVLGVAQALALYEPAFRTVVEWCADEPARSRALLVVTSIGGFASTVFLPLASWLVVTTGWRAALLVLAAVLAAIVIPLRFALPLPAGDGRRAAPVPAGAPPSERVLARGLVLHALASTGVFVYLPWYLVERGESLAAAAALAGLAGAAQVPGRLLASALRRRGSLAWLLAIQAGALLGLVAGGGLGCILLLGAASGSVTLERAAVLVAWYGRETFGTRQGRLAAATSTARALSPFVVEAGHQVASYAGVFGVLALVLVAGAWACRGATRLRDRERLTSRACTAADAA